MALPAVSHLFLSSLLSHSREPPFTFGRATLSTTKRSIRRTQGLVEVMSLPYWEAPSIEIMKNYFIFLVLVGTLGGPKRKRSKKKNWVQFIRSASQLFSSKRLPSVVLFSDWHCRAVFNKDLCSFRKFFL